MEKTIENQQGYVYHCKETEHIPAIQDYLCRMSQFPEKETQDIFNKLIHEGIFIHLNNEGNDNNDNLSEHLSLILQNLIWYRHLSIHSHAENPMAVLTPAGPYFNPKEKIDTSASNWKLSRFSYIHSENGNIVLRNPNAFCFLMLKNPALLKMYYFLNQPIDKKVLKKSMNIGEQYDIIFLMFVWAKIILPCTENDKTEEDSPTLMQWDFHDLLFHSMSRMGRTEKDMGGSFRFRGILPSQPAIKTNPWIDGVTIKLPVPDLSILLHRDMSLTAAIESRRSIREYSIIPLTKNQVGEFLYRTARIRYEYTNELGDFVSKPYPGGGACYESEFYITVNACSGIPRGIYYYDAKEHLLCLIQEPNNEMEGLLEEATIATARLGTPQILITLASRFNRFNWKYSSMSYAAQLKNVGVIYQTMYLVATAMNIGGCALGVGNTDRFCKIMGLNYLEEGSIGEFMIGRPLII